MLVNREQIVDDLAKTDFLVFAGAGISSPTKVDTWSELMIRFNEGLREVSGNVLRGIEVGKVEAGLYPELAQMFYEKYCEFESADKYFEIVQRGTESKATTETGTQLDLIMESFNHSIITTNFDSTIENAYQKLTDVNFLESEMTYQTLGALKHKIENSQITYLHGRYDSNEIVLKTSDYEKYYSEYTIRKELYKFVGFSFDDRYLLRAFKTICEEIIESQSTLYTNPNTPKKKHYAFIESLPEDTFEKMEPTKKIALQKRDENEKLMRGKLIDHLDSFGIDVYEYKNIYHKEIGEIMQEIREKRTLRSIA